MYQILTYFLLFGIIFFVLPLGHSPFEVPKTFITLLIISILAIFILGESIFSLLRRKSSFKLNPLKLTAVVLLISISIYHLFYSTYPEHLFLGNSWRPQGTILYLSLFILFIITTKLSRNITNYSRISFIVLILLLIFTILIGHKGSFRFIGPLGEPSALGATVLFLFPFAVSSQNKKQKLISLIVAFVLLLFSGSRSVFLGFFTEIIFLFLIKSKLFIPGIITLVIFLVFSFASPFLPHSIPSNLSLRFENRAEIWQVGVEASKYSMFLGSGFGSIQDVLYDYSWKLKSFTRFQSVDSAHNLFLDWQISAGIIGTLILIILISFTYKNLYRKQNTTFLAALTGILIVMLFNPVSIVNLIHFWWILGIGIDSD